MFYMLEMGVIAFLATFAGVLLFVVGYFMGERNAKRVEQTPPISAKAVSEPQRVPPAPPENTGYGRLKVRSPREVIFEEQQKRDGIVPTPKIPQIPPAVRKDFLKEAEAVAASR